MKILVTFFVFLFISTSLFAQDQCLTHAQIDGVVNRVAQDLKDRDYKAIAKQTEEGIRDAVNNHDELLKLETYGASVTGLEKLALTVRLTDKLVSQSWNAFLTPVETQIAIEKGKGPIECHEADTNSSFSEKIYWECTKKGPGELNRLSFWTNSEGFITATIERHVRESRMPVPISYEILSTYRERYGKPESSGLYVSFITESGGLNVPVDSDLKTFRESLANQVGCR